MPGKKSGAKKQGLEASLNVVKEITQLLTKGIDKSPPWLVPLIVIPGLAAMITCVISSYLIMNGNSEYGYFIAMATLVFLGIALVCSIVAIRIGKQPGDGKDYGQDSGKHPPVPETPGCPTNAPLLKQAWGMVKSGQHDDILVRRFCCPKDQPISPSKLDRYSIYHLWADPRGGSIKASLSETDGPNHLIVDFENGPNCWAGNVTVRPCGLNPFAKAPEHRYLSMDLQIPKPTQRDDLENIGVAFRLYDERGTIWYWGRSENDLKTRKIKASTGKWQTVSLPLDPAEWRLFESDGNHVYWDQNGPAFKRMILAVVIVTGGYLENLQPGAGKGRILLKNIRFENEPPGTN